MERIFYKTGVDISSVKSMFEFLAGHFKYYTQNSWNKKKSYANDVKLYNLKIDEKKYPMVFDMVMGNVVGGRYDSDDFEFDQAYAISKFEEEHPGYRVGFNGTSYGYLVLYADGCGTAIPDWLDSGDYEDWKNYLHEYSEFVRYYKSELRALVKVVRDFDSLCDELADIVRNR